MLHGFTGSAHTLVDVAAGLSDRHRTIRVDLLGHGRSDAPVEVDAYRMQRCVSDLAGVLDALSVPRAHVLGYSMGGRVALHLTVARPARVASLILVGASAGIADAAKRRERRRADEALAASIRRDGVPAFVERWMALPLFATQRRLGARFLARARAQRLAQRADGLAGSLAGLGAGAQEPLHACLGNVRVPVLVVVGDEDAKFQPIARELAARLPRARLALLDGAGHAAHLERPEPFLALIRAFLAEAEATSPAGLLARSEHEGGQIHEHP
jgi:2-succinyl-6-hydroxy-2,4-cyclohexadiene-1-carboxylate synthase